ncbi:FliM/FliN family flagellar motor switch protein [Novosphingobium beihaiensis]|uniref:FliM/FliN family flagellar motor C-terminal domain-containing protein n=1 Tax=Novosphingobium beihaiensis TaxID=2930389 RepID=A0ABT0BPJ9_9SPHN|nr:FliM/FliN family flagellar motor C-terminal domain-containing protein [Novosphingobium beihaiensis]MCJ2186982.1 FliM/FliN family flagellar motor C-terminal domain-containing protein [Novosphingobium beihaiensis]
MSNEQAQLESRKLSQGLVDKVEVEVEVVLGAARLTIAQLEKLGPDDLIELNHAINEPVSLRLNGQTFAYGEIVTVGDQFAVRIDRLDA